MKIVHIPLRDGGNGGAIAAYRLHRALLDLGHDSSMFVAYKEGNDPTVQAFQPPMDVVSGLRRRLRNLQITRALGRYSVVESFYDDRSRYGASMLVQLPPADIINVHQASHFIDYETFFTTVPRRVPVVQTLHDMTVFTGGAPYCGDCHRYTARCGACPQLGSNKQDDLSRHVWQRKHRAFRTVPPARLHVVAPSRWLADEAKRSSLLQRFPVSVIPYGLNTAVFWPRDRELARKVLGISSDARIVLFIAQPVTRLYKGFVFLAHALNRMEVSNLMLVVVGSKSLPSELRVPHLHLGHIENERLLSFVYSAADVCVVPSLQENFPQTALEAVACGIPVVGSEVGGIPDIVRPNVTGLLVPPRDVTALQTAISELLRDPTRRRQMSANCRRIAEEEYTLELQAQRYSALYQAILAGKGSSAFAEEFSTGLLRPTPEVAAEPRTT